MTVTACKVTVKLRRTSDGAVRDVVQEWSASSLEANARDAARHGEDPVESMRDGISYLWEEGNYACDCNRGDFFARAGGESDPHQPCGDFAYEVDDITIYIATVDPLRVSPILLTGGHE